MINKSLFSTISYAIVSFLLILPTSFVYAYGGSGGGTSPHCTPATFSEENPAPKAEIPELSKFSFVASSNTNPLTIKVEIRDQEGKVKTTEQPDGSLLVEGKIPEPITGEKYARVDIYAKTKSGCPSHHNYLVKVIGEGQQGKQASEKSQSKKSEKCTGAHKEHEKSAD